MLTVFGCKAGRCKITHLFYFCKQNGGFFAGAIREAEAGREYGRIHEPLSEFCVIFA